jgi:hypothetical protein
MTLIKKVGIQRQAGYIYFVDTEGDITRVRFGNKRIESREKVFKLGLKKNPAYYYYLDGRGNLVASPKTQEGLNEN